jgi:uncharacterized repeat protein (TIGR03987 family)
MWRLRIPPRNSMPPLVRAAVLLMVTAFVLYSSGVWAVFLARHLRPWHAGLFWLGFFSDGAGTEMMRRLAGGFHWNLHTATGAAALLLMLGHALWATRTLMKGAEGPIHTFHRISITVWVVWLIPFVSGMILGRRMGH